MDGNKFKKRAQDIKRISRVLRDNLKKRKVFQDKIQKKIAKNNK